MADQKGIIPIGNWKVTGTPPDRLEITFRDPSALSQQAATTYKQRGEAKRELYFNLTDMDVPVEAAGLFKDDANTATIMVRGADIKERANAKKLPIHDIGTRLTITGAENVATVCAACMENSQPIVAALRNGVTKINAPFAISKEGDKERAVVTSDDRSKLRIEDKKGYRFKFDSPEQATAAGEMLAATFAVKGIVLDKSHLRRSKDGLTIDVIDPRTPPERSAGMPNPLEEVVKELTSNINLARQSAISKPLDRTVLAPLEGQSAGGVHQLPPEIRGAAQARKTPTPSPAASEQSAFNTLGGNAGVFRMDADFLAQVRGLNPEVLRKEKEAAIAALGDAGIKGITLNGTTSKDGSKIYLLKLDVNPGVDPQTLIPILKQATGIDFKIPAGGAALQVEYLRTDSGLNAVLEQTSQLEAATGKRSHKTGDMTYPITQVGRVQSDKPTDLPGNGR